MLEMGNLQEASHNVSQVPSGLKFIKGWYSNEFEKVADWEVDKLTNLRLHSATSGDVPKDGNAS